MLVILANCIFLALFDPLQPKESEWNKMLNTAEIAFTSLFALEFLLQAGARNFLLGHGAYLKDVWYCLDFLILVAGFVALAPGMGNLTGVRTIRALKPLKTINGVPRLRMLANTLLESLPMLASALFIIMLLFMIFGILGLYWRAALRQRCAFVSTGDFALSRLERPCSSALQCDAGQVCAPLGQAPNYGYTSFDNVLWSLLNVFQAVTLDNWSEIMYVAGEAREQEVSAAFFIVLIIMGAYCALSLLTAIVSAKYRQTAEREERLSKVSRKRQEEWRDETLAYFLQFRSFRVLHGFMASKWPMQAAVKRFTDSGAFYAFFTLCILANATTIAMHWHNMPESLSRGLLIADWTFTSLFFVEMFFKLWGLGAVAYWTDPWDCSDGLITVLSTVEMCLHIAQGIDTEVEGTGLDVLRTFRILRVLRSMKVLRKHKGLKRLFGTVSQGLSSLMDFIVLLSLFVFIFSILGVQFFGGMPEFQGKRRNFDGIGSSVLVIFEMLTGSNWAETMWVAMQGRVIYSLFFISWIVFGKMILLNLFLAILIATFSADNDLAIGSQGVARDDQEHLDVKIDRDLVHDRVVRRRQRLFAKDAQKMKRWLLDIGETYGVNEEQIKQFEEAERQTLFDEEAAHDDGLPHKLLKPFQKKHIQAAKKQGVPNITIALNKDQNQGRKKIAQRHSVARLAGLVKAAGAFQTGDRTPSRRTSAPAFSMPHEDVGFSGRSSPRGTDTDGSYDAEVGEAFVGDDSEQGGQYDDDYAYDEDYTYGEDGEFYEDDSAYFEEVGGHEEVPLNVSKPAAARKSVTFQIPPQSPLADEEPEESTFQIPPGLNIPGYRGAEAPNEEDVLEVQYRSPDHLPGAPGPVTEAVEHPDTLQHRNPLREPQPSDTLGDAPGHDSWSRPEWSAGSHEPGEPATSGVGERRGSAGEESGAFLPKGAGGASSSSVSWLGSRHKKVDNTIERVTIKPIISDARVEGRMRDSLVLGPAAGRSLLQAGEPATHDTLMAGVKEANFSTKKETKQYTQVHAEFPVFLKHSSLFIFSSKSTTRRTAFLIVSSKAHQNFILLLVCLSSVILAMQSPSLDEKSTLGEILGTADLCFNVFFAVECLFKIMAMGLCLHPGSYLRSVWNWIDFLTVAAACVGIAFDLKNLTIIKAVRLVQLLRPLRTISRLHGLRLVVASLLSSVSPMTNVMFLGFVLFAIYGILGVQLMGGLFYRCNDDSVAERAACVGTYIDAAGLVKERLWRNSLFNFDNVFHAMLSLFVVSTMDNWMDLAYMGMDSTQVDQQPQRNNRPYMVLFFIAFIILGSFFWVNILVSVIVDQYCRVQSETGRIAFATEGQKQWMQALRMKKYENEMKRKAKFPKGKLRQFIFLLVQHPNFETFIIVCIILNAAVKATLHADQTAGWGALQRLGNDAFTGIFIAEVVLKNVALTPNIYWQDYWNRFDFITTLMSIPEYFGLNLNSTAFRILRIGHMFRSKGPRALFRTLMLALPSLLNVGGIIFLLIYAYSIIGMHIFGGVAAEGGANRDANFQTFAKSIWTLFRVFTMDGWSQLMTEAMDCDPRAVDCGFKPEAPIFFLSSIVLSAHMTMNLFTAVVVERFQESAIMEGIITTESFFVSLQRKLMLDRFVDRLTSSIRRRKAMLAGRRAAVAANHRRADAGAPAPAPPPSSSFF